MKPQLSSSKCPRLHKFFIFFLYSLPVIFSLLTVFLITTSGEDNFQGAGNLRNGTEINVLRDAKNAFEYNSRLTDVYAWSAIDFYDYQFQFGPDTILRLIDVFSITAVFYLSTYIILNRKPKLELKDALIFCGVFSTFIITPFGRAFYDEFSMIHNYVPLALIFLLFCIPYLHLITNPRPPKFTVIFAAIMLIAGIIFGMSATITPLAFLATTIIYIIVRRKHLTKPPLWFYTGLIGTITGFLICWLAGTGIDHYTNPITAATFDYLPLKNIFTNFGKLAWHEVYNFGLTLLPLIIFTLIALPFLKNLKKLFSKTHLTHLPTSTINLIIISITFVIIHILGASLVKAPPRLLIPAYLAGLIVIFRLFIPHLKFNTFFVSIITIATTLIVIIHGAFLIKYHLEMSIVLNDIKNSPENTICIETNETRPTRIPIINLTQANIIVDWGEPEPIYNKGIVSCQ